MAEDIKLKINLDTKSATTSANDMAKAMDDVSKKTKEADKDINKFANDTKKAGADSSLEKRLKDLNKTVKESPVNIRAMNRQIQEYQAIALEAGRESPIGKAALAEAAAMRDRYVDIQNEVKRLSNDGVKLQAALDLGTSVVAGFTAVKGATALLGVENENLQETMVKLQAAQSVLVGVETIRKNLEKESTLILIAKNSAEKISLASTKALTGAQKALNAVMKANPLGLIVTAIGLVAAGFVAFSDTIKRAVMPVLEPLIDSFDAVKNGIKSVGEFLGLIPSEAEKAAKAQEEAARIAVKAEIDKQREIANSLEKERAERTKTFDKEIQLRKAAGEDTKEIEKDKLKFIIESLQKENEARQKARELERKQADEFNNAITKDFGDAFKKRIELEEKANKERLEQAKFNLELFEIEEQKAADEAAKNRQKEANDRLKKQQENNQKEQELLKKQKQDLRKLEIENIEDDELREIAKIQNEKELREQAARDTITDAETLAKTLQQIRIKANNDLNEIDAKYREEERIKEEEREQLEAERRQAIEDRKNEALKAALEQQQAARDEANRIALENEQAKADALQMIEESSLQIAQDLINLGIKDAAKAEDAQKKLAVVQLAIDTARSLSSTIAGASAAAATAGPAAPFVLAGYIASGIATITSALAQAKQILSTTGANAPSVSGSVGGSSPAQGVPINAVDSGSTFINPTQDSDNMQVYVLETDISGTQNNVINVEQTATLD